MWEQKRKTDGVWKCLSARLTALLFTEATLSNIPRCTRVQSVSRGLLDSERAAAIEPSGFCLLDCSFVRPDRRPVKLLSLELLWVYAAHVALRQDRRYAPLCFAGPSLAAGLSLALARCGRRHHSLPLPTPARKVTPGLMRTARSAGYFLAPLKLGPLEEVMLLWRFLIIALKKMKAKTKK